MKIEPATAQVFRIEDAPALDPITVVLMDYGNGKGKIIVEVFGTAWSAYWGAMGSTLIRFLSNCNPDYVASRMMPGDRRILKREEAYLKRVVVAVLEAIEQQVAAA